MAQGENGESNKKKMKIKSQQNENENGSERKRENTSRSYRNDITIFIQATIFINFADDYCDYLPSFECFGALVVQNDNHVH